jgi:CRP/FNR family transcriptional regulator
MSVIEFRASDKNHFLPEKFVMETRIGNGCTVRLRKFTRLIEDLSLKEVPSRIAAYLLHLSNKKHDTGHIEINITKGQPASLLGTITEILSRILSKMNKQHLVKTKGSHITVVDPMGLEKIAREEKKLSHI